MLLNKRSFFFAIIIFALYCEISACAELSSVSKGANIWADTLMQNCTSLSGEYYSIGEVNIPNELNIKSPRLESSIFGIDKYGIEVSSVLLRQHPESGLDIVLKNKQGDLLFSRAIIEPSQCNGSWTIFESTVKGSGDGSSVIETHTVTRLARSIDESLIVTVSVNTTERSWFFMKKSSRIEVWYRFSKMTNTGFGFSPN